MLDTANALGGHSRAPQSYEIFISAETTHDDGWPQFVTLTDTVMQSSRVYFSSGYVPDEYAKMSTLIAYAAFAGGLAMMGGLWWLVS